MYIEGLNALINNILIRKNYVINIPGTRLYHKTQHPFLSLGA